MISRRLFLPALLWPTFFGSFFWTFWSFVFLAGPAAAQDARCSRASERVVEVAGFGTAYFSDVRLEGGVAELFGGVCLESEAREADGAPLWTLRVEEMRFDTQLERTNLSLGEVNLTVGAWLITAAALESSEGGFRLEGVDLEGEHLRGRARAAFYDLATEEILFVAVEVRGQDYQLSGARARLAGTSLLVEDALATTCVCAGGFGDRLDNKLYVVTTPQAQVDLEGDVVVIRDGVLVSGGVTVALPAELELSAQSLADLQFPLQIEYLSEGEASGLGLLTPELPLAEGWTLQTGVVGLDKPQRRDGIFLLRLRQPGVSADIGKAREGPQGDVVVEKAVSPWLNAVFGVHNRHWLKQDFLHEGFFRLLATQTLPSPLPGDRLELAAEGVAAVSNQTLPEGPVLSPRLGLSYRLTYSLPPLAIGNVSVLHVASLSHYPATATQYGLRLAPSWNAGFGPLTLSLAYNLQVTNSASPFSPRLDRLLPASMLTGGLRLEGEVGAGVSGHLALQGRYDFLAEEGVRSSWRELSLSSSATWQRDAWTVTPSLRLEAAGLTNRSDEDIKAFVAGELGVGREGWQFGLRSRYNLLAAGTEAGLEQLEFSLGLPLTSAEFSLEPFVALDVAGYLNGGAGMVLAGHGLTLEWRHPCGTLRLGYRQHGDRSFTTFGIGLPGP